MNDISIRYPAVAGSFYPEDENELKEMINDYLAKAKDINIDGTLRALVEPHAGYIYSGPVAAYGYKLLKKYADKTSKIILIGPSHYAAFYGACEAGYDFWETPLGKVRAKSIRENLQNEYKNLIRVYKEAHEPEHCLEVQLPFLQTVLKDFTIYPLLCGDVNPAELANALLDQIDNKTVVIASSDLSHYLPYDQAVRTDRIANESVPALEIKRFEQYGDACGKIGILTLMHIAKKNGWKGKLLDYRNSGDTAGPRTQVVGYGCYAFYE
jgi:AmmeMemoRadiSam system protein B